MRSFSITLIITILLPSLVSCQKKTDTAKSAESTNEAFSNYWYAGVAELNSYKLEQARYGEVHDGEAVLIFVTEPFSKSKQVKLDNPNQKPGDMQTVMKLNFTKKFNTGIYPYSMMLSAFTPVDVSQRTPKVTMSSQEWCGHTFAQLNYRKDKYLLTAFSYFEQEGDQLLEVESSHTEDELWNTIRINPDALPLGDIKILPGLFHSRLLHKNFEPKAAKAYLSTNGDNKTYVLDYREEQRKLEITFTSAFPHKIMGWKETIVGLNGKTMTTSATLDKTLLTDYWNRNKPSDEYLRDSLNLN